MFMAFVMFPFLGSVIKAWELGIPTMKRGEVAVFHCEPKYAYGKKGLPEKVPPNEAVIYEIELFSWRGVYIHGYLFLGSFKCYIKA